MFLLLFAFFLGIPRGTRWLDSDLHDCVLVLLVMPEPPHTSSVFYCPTCAEEVRDPLTCGDCGAIICRKCGTPLESPDELGIG